MKKIIIATDFSEHSRYTIEYVLNHLQSVDEPCKIILLNTYMVNETNPHEVISANDRLKIISRTGLEFEKLETLRLIRNRNIEVETASHIGSLSNVILQLTKNDDIALVALGKNDGKIVETVANVLKKRHCLLLVTELPEEKKEAAI